MHVTIIADASFCPNTRVAGYAFWIASERGKLGGSGAFKDRVQSSLIAEMMALVNGLHVAAREQLVQQGDKVLLQTDCMAAIHALPKLRYFLSKDEERISAYYRKLVDAVGVVIEFRHVKGHTTRNEPRYFVNNKCDELAKAAMRKERDKYYRMQNLQLGKVH